jgi:hypothetical protein
LRLVQKSSRSSLKTNLVAWRDGHRIVPRSCDVPAVMCVMCNDQRLPVVQGGQRATGREIVARKALRRGSSRARSAL